MGTTHGWLVPTVETQKTKPDKTDEKKYSETDKLESEANRYLARIPL